ncbi:MAG: leucine--tRNA ligase [Arsenophonus sp.]|nr:MAG: leucine--tRNA ligase [Arsenophonus sp.]
MDKKYQAKKIEKYVQLYWKNKKTFEVSENSHKKKYYCLSMLPYPSGHLHMGHVRNYVITDVIARYQRMLGKNVLHPMGWDAFGLPAENAAIESNISPDSWTYLNIQYMKKQLENLGLSYDWKREIITCNPNYYRWEQWFFIQLYKKGLVYRKKSLVNWCSNDATVLANEQVINGNCWRCNTPVVYKKIPQWFIKITKYADELLDGLDQLHEWPEDVKAMQRNWIGRSKGFEIQFEIINSNKKIVIYTTRPDLFMGITYIAISPFHKFSIYLSKLNKNVKFFINQFKRANTLLDNEKHNKNVGLNTNCYVLHPFTKEKVPIWIANYVSSEYASGAIMGVPAHNLSDWNFAKKYNLPIKIVIDSTKNEIINILNKPILKKNKLVNSGIFNNMNHDIAFDTIIQKLINKGLAKKKIYFKLKDWCISRQRYWGAPIPMIINRNGQYNPVEESYLPVVLSKKYLRNIKEKKNFSEILKKDNKFSFIQEKDTFDTFIESSWYYARYTSPNYDKGMVDPDLANYWLPVDQYVGGIEHAIMHLLYFRFFHKLMRDFGLVNSDEPVKKLLCQGMVLSDAFYYLNKKKQKTWISYKEVIINKDLKGNTVSVTDQLGRKVFIKKMTKMSKSKKNGVDPEEMIEKYGADTVRLFIVSAAPPNINIEWNQSGLIGANKFICRLWDFAFKLIHFKKNIVSFKKNVDKYKINEFRHFLYETISKVTDNMNRRYAFNSAVSSVFKLMNKMKIFSFEIQEEKAIIEECFNIIIKMLFPIIPHVCFIIWKKLGNKQDIDYTQWPVLDKKKLFKKMTTKIILQVNGKFRKCIEVPIDLKKDKLVSIAINEYIIKKYLKNFKIYRLIYIKNKLLNFLVKSNEG